MSPLFCYAQEIQKVNISVHNELLLIKDFKDMRGNIIQNGLLAFENIITAEPELRDVSDTTVENTVEDLSKKPTEFSKSLKERRIEAHQGWKSMTEEDKKEFFSSLPKAAEERLKNRQEFLRTRLGLKPTRGANKANSK